MINITVTYGESKDIGIGIEVPGVPGTKTNKNYISLYILFCTYRYLSIKYFFNLFIY